MTVHESGQAPSPATGGVPITDLFAVGEDGVSRAVLAPSGGASRGFGGHVAAVTLAAAYATVPPGLSVHHVHVEFLRPAISGCPLRASVRSFRDGRTIGRRFVEVAHDGEPPCAIATVTFNHRDDRGPEHQPPMPPAPDVAEVPLGRTDPVEIRRAADPADPAHQQTWLRPRVRPLAAEPWLHDCALLFLSDYTILWPTLTVHGLDPERHRHTATGSVAHTMWFHRPGRADDWLLHDQRAPATSGGLGHAEGRIFSRSGVLLASVTQVGLLRPPRVLAPARG
jgi:acyl-CoA thioesterase-2